MPLPGSEVGTFEAGSTNTPRVGIFDGSKLFGSRTCFRQWSLMICILDEVGCDCSCACAPDPLVKQTSIVNRYLIDSGKWILSIVRPQQKIIATILLLGE